MRVPGRRGLGSPPCLTVTDAKFFPQSLSPGEKLAGATDASRRGIAAKTAAINRRLSGSRRMDRLTIMGTAAPLSSCQAPPCGSSNE